MKYLILLLSLSAGATNRYISPTGNDGNAGTIGSPWRTITKGWSVLVAGDTLFCRGGTYPTNVQQSLSSKSGTSGSRICIFNYPGEAPVFDWSGVVLSGQIRGLNFSNVSYVHMKGIRVTGIAQTTTQNSYNYGISLNNNDNNNILENCTADHIGGTGIQVGAGCNGNLLLNCDSYYNSDPFSPNGAYENGNGYELAQNVQGVSTIIRYCRAWYNVDDGFDAYNGQGAHTYEGCWSFLNGFIPGTSTPAGNGQGFKMGPVPVNINSVIRTVTNCLAFANRVFGFDYNSGTFDYKAVLYNNTAYGNGNIGYHFNDASFANIIKNNIAYGQLGGGSQSGAMGSGLTQSNNTWQGGVTVSDADFLSVSNAGMDGPRQANGSLPVLNFMKLAGGSDLIDAGVNVGLSFSGAAPDMGAFENGVVAPGNIPPVANAGSNVTITLPVISVSLSGSGSDADGTVATYNWTKISGPVSGIITTPSNQNTTITGLSQGVYIFQLEVIDDLGAPGVDDIQITVGSGYLGVLRGGDRIKFISL